MSNIPHARDILRRVRMSIMVERRRLEREFEDAKELHEARLARLEVQESNIEAAVSYMFRDMSG